MISERQVAQALISFLGVMTAGLVLVLMFRGESIWFSIVVGSTSMLFFGLLIAERRNWKYTRLILILLLTILPPLTLIELSPGAAIATMIAPAAAVILVEARWVLLSGVITTLGLSLRTGVQPESYSYIGLALIVTGTLALARLVLNQARTRAEALAKRTDEALEQAQKEAQQNAQQAHILSEQNMRQQQLLELVSELEVPTLTLSDRTLLAPIVGAIDSQRASRFMERILNDVMEARAQLLIIDIAGVPVVDSDVAKALTRTAQAVRLLGCDVCLSGISAPVAITLTHSSIGLDQIRTIRSLQDLWDGSSIGK